MGKEILNFPFPKYTSLSLYHYISSLPAPCACCSARESTLNEPSNLTTGEVNQDTNDVRLVRALISLFNSGELVKLWINHYEVCFEPFPICVL